jgi:hypothetical protein
VLETGSRLDREPTIAHEPELRPRASDIRDFDFELLDLSEESILENAADHTVVQGTFWFSTLPDVCLTEIHYRLSSEDRVANAAGIEASMRGVACALIECAKTWGDDGPVGQQFLDYVHRWEAKITVHCLDCAVDTKSIGHDYMLDHRLWISTRPEVLGKLCLPSAEKRLGRELSMGDVTDFPINRDVGCLLAQLRAQRLQ